MIDNLTLLYYFGEERLISIKKDKIKIPYNIGVILDNQTYEKIIFKLLKFINWNLKLGVSYINLYDPFHVIKQENYEHFKSLITLIYSKKFNIADKSSANSTCFNINNNKDIILINKSEFFNVSICQAFEEKDLIYERKKIHLSEKSSLIKDRSIDVNKGISKAEFNLFKEKFKFNKNEFLIIKFLDFIEANIDFIDFFKIKDYGNDQSLGIINSCMFEKKEDKHIFSNKYENKSLYKIESRYLTRKETNELPEILINFTKTELCMFGFPFVLMENSEIL